MRKFIVTRAAGFSGFHFIEALLQGGETVMGIDEINHYYDPDLEWQDLP